MLYLICGIAGAIVGGLGVVGMLLLAGGMEEEPFADFQRRKEPGWW